MSKIANYLKDHIRGEVVSSDHGRAGHASDNAIINSQPMLIVHPFDINDIRKTLHFTWQLAQKGYTLPVVVRGGGTNATGATITNGIVVDCTTHLTQILELDTKQKLIRVQPGLRLDVLQQTLRTHGLEWPVGSVSKNATVGGVIAGQIIGKRNTALADWVDQIELVLASGEVVQIGRMSKRGLNKKRGSTDSEGEIYRQIDTLLSDEEVYESTDSSGGQFNLSQVRATKNSFDLVSLITGSQGALGVISEVILKLDTLYSDTEVLFVGLTSLDQYDKLVKDTLKLEPDSLQYVPASVLEYVKDQHNVVLHELIDKDEFASTIGCLFIVFRGPKSKHKAKKAAKWFDKAGQRVVKSDGDYDAAREIMQVQHAIEYTVLALEKDHKVATPLIDDAAIDGTKAVDLADGIEEIAKKHRVTILWWVDVLSNVMTAYPLLNLKNLTDRQKVSKLVEEYYAYIVSQGGQVAGRYNVGVVKKLLLPDLYTEAELNSAQKIKNIFDEYNILNPEFTSGKKRDITKLIDESYTPAISLSTIDSI